VNSLSPTDLELLRALLDRLIPADDFPGAVGAGVEHYIIRQLAGDLLPKFSVVAGGLRELECEAGARHSRSFLALTAAEQDALLLDLESGRTRYRWQGAPKIFFDLMVNLAAEGFYADPGNGGNQGSVSWKMIGYDPGVGSEAP
jgi:hypothetical protein